MKKKTTIVGFIEIWFAALWIIFSVMLLALYVFLSTQLKNTLVRKGNMENIRQIENLLINDENGNLIIEEPYVLDKGYYVVLLNKENEVIAGSYPTALDGFVFESRKEEIREIKGKSYCFTYFRTHRHKDGEKYTLCGIADIRAAATMLDQVRTNIVAFFIIGMSGIVILFLFMSERIGRPLRRMREEVEKLGTDGFIGTASAESGFVEIDMLEEAYRRLYERMALAIESQNRFNTDVSHELRTPITVIQTQCQIGKERALESKDTETAEMMDVVERQAGKMNQIINILMLLSKLENGADRLSPEEFDLATLIETVTEDEEFLQASDRKIVCELEETTISADVNLIMIAFRNILSNAVKYSSDGSEIRIRCGTEGERPFCSVSDQGIGIQKESMDQIFNDFYRAEESRSSEGVGLGLSIAKKIMEIHGGEITVQSVPGEGSTFTLYFAPLPRQAAAYET